MLYLNKKQIKFLQWVKPPRLKWLALWFYIFNFTTIKKHTLLFKINKQRYDNR